MNILVNILVFILFIAFLGKVLYNIHIWQIMIYYIYISYIFYLIIQIFDIRGDQMEYEY